MRRLIQVSLLTAAMSLSGFSVGQSLEEGAHAFDMGDYSTAIDNFRPLAEQGEMVSQAVMGTMYSEGKGVPQDYSQAVHWYRRAAEQGSSYAQAELGRMYRSGEGTTQDYGEAVKWFRLAAEQGNLSAQADLGHAFQVGRGVPQNFLEAAQWYRRAAEQGMAYAQGHLGYMYSKGMGVSRNLVMAYILTSLAATESKVGYPHLRDTTLEKLNREQIAEGQRLASEWQVGKPLPTTKDTKTWP
ncbi:tetratricopeptide repeat protein [Halomonas aquatica]|uniref:Tetratricopeptide repeat protein n=1 Tax=Halomonas aquatica TaxID=3151123 RepID=A0ABV1NI73_9GAMM